MSHEFSIAQDLIRLVNQKAVKGEVKKINSVKVVIGELSGMSPDHFAEDWKIVAKGTPAENARLEFVDFRAEGRCAKCKKEFAIREHGYKCPICKGEDIEATKGKEFYIESIEGE